MLDESEHKPLAETLSQQFQYFTAPKAYAKSTQYGFDLSHLDAADLLPRVSDSRFWIGQIRKRSKELLSELERSIGLVSSRRAKYCGDLTHKQFKAI